MEDQWFKIVHDYTAQASLSYTRVPPSQKSKRRRKRKKKRNAK